MGSNQAQSGCSTLSGFVCLFVMTVALENNRL